MKRPKNTDPEALIELGKYVRELRQARDLTATEMAQRTGSSRTFVNYLERGITLPRMEKWMVLGQLLCTSEEEYATFREKFLASMGMAGKHIPSIPETLKLLREIDPKSPDMPRGAADALNRRQDLTSRHLAVKRLSEYCAEAGITHEIIFDEKSQRTIVNGVLQPDVLIKRGRQKPLPLFILITNEDKPYRPSWLFSVVGGILLSHHYLSSRDGLILVHGPMPELLGEHEYALKCYDLSLCDWDSLSQYM